jgi:hypothetical protein
VCQGLQNERAAHDVEALLRRFEVVSMVGEAIAVASARNFRFLRRRGIAVRKTIDRLIGTWCIENRMPLPSNLAHLQKVGLALESFQHWLRHDAATSLDAFS